MERQMLRREVANPAAIQKTKTLAQIYTDLKNIQNSTEKTQPPNVVSQSQGGWKYSDNWGPKSCPNISNPLYVITNIKVNQYRPQQSISLMTIEK